MTRHRMQRRNQHPTHSSNHRRTATPIKENTPKGVAICYPLATWATGGALSPGHRRPRQHDQRPRRRPGRQLGPKTGPVEAKPRPTHRENTRRPLLYRLKRTRSSPQSRPRGYGWTPHGAEALQRPLTALQTRHRRRTGATNSTFCTRSFLDA